MANRKINSLHDVKRGENNFPIQLRMHGSTGQVDWWILYKTAQHPGMEIYGEYHNTSRKGAGSIQFLTLAQAEAKVEENGWQ